MGILAGLALKAGYSSLSEYLRKEGLPWLQTKNETIAEQINSSHELVKMYKEGIARINELIETRRLLHSRETREANRRQERIDFLKMMALLGHKPDEIEKMVSQLERFDPSATMGDSPATWVQPTSRPRALPPIVIEETPLPPNIKPSRLDPDPDKQSMAEAQPSQQAVSKQYPTDANAREFRSFMERLDRSKRKNETGRAGPE